MEQNFFNVCGFEPRLEHIHLEIQSLYKMKYNGIPLKLDAWLTRFTFSAAISKSLELKRSSIAL